MKNHVVSSPQLFLSVSRTSKATCLAPTKAIFPGNGFKAIDANSESSPMLRSSRMKTL